MALQALQGSLSERAPGSGAVISKDLASSPAEGFEVVQRWFEEQTMMAFAETLQHGSGVPRATPELRWVPVK